MTTFIAERQTAPAELRDMAVLNNGELLPSHPGAADSLFLFEEENTAMAAALGEIGPERSRDSRHFKGNIHVVSAGAAAQAGVGGTRSSLAMFDAERGRGVLADGGGSAVAARTVARGFLRAMGRNKPEQLITSYDAAEAMRRATAKADAALGKTKGQLSSLYEDASASFSGFQFLYQGRMAVSHSGDTAIMVYDPEGWCRKITQDNDDRLHGTAARRGSKPEGPGSTHTVVSLRPGRNVIIMTNRGSIGGMSALQIGELLSELDLESSDPENGSAIASHIMAHSPNGGSDGNVMAVVVDIDATEDKRSRFRKSLDPLRISTLVFGVMAGVTKPGISRRALYDEPTKRGESWRKLSRAVDITTAAMGAVATYNLAKHLEIDIRHIADNGVFDDVVRALGFDPAAQPAITGTGAEAAPQSLVPDAIAAQDPPIIDTDTSAETDDNYPDEREADSSDSSSGRASNVSDWSIQAIEYYGKQEGLTPGQITDITSDWDTISRVNDGLIADNHDVAVHPLNYLMDGGVYDTAGQNDVAHQVVLDWKSEHIPQTAPVPVPEPVDVAPPEPPAPPPVEPANQDPALSAPAGITDNFDTRDYLVTAAAATAVVAAVGAAAYSKRRRNRKINELAEREGSGMARSHNSKYREALDRAAEKRGNPTQRSARRRTDTGGSDFFAAVT